MRAIILIIGLFPCVQAWSSETSAPSRRAWLASTFNAVVLAGGATRANGAEELPLALRDFTKLAPLGRPETGSTTKTYNLPLKELAARLEHDLLVGSSGNGPTLFTGDFSTDIFRDDCEFVDPTNRVSSLSQCQKALQILFDPESSQLKLLEPLVVNEEDRTISGKFRVYGFLKFPWKPFVSAYESNIVYKIDENGLVSEQRQQWTKSASKALQESFTPTVFTPPPKSILPKPDKEPTDVTALFDMVNGRRPAEYSQEERSELARLVESIVDRRYPWKSDLFPGRWRLVYLEPGPDGAGVDRRIPFPEFPFNDNFQIFTSDDTVTNVGELFGPPLSVRVYGGLQEDDPTSKTVPKRFKAQITGGELNWDDRTLANLPITGEGIFDGVYLGERLRIGQNLNGGGARIVQVRME